MAMAGKNHSNRFRRWLTTTLCVASILSAPIILAATLNEAVQQVQQQTGGRILSAQTVRQGGRSVHRIKVLTPSGRVRVIIVDAGGR